MTMTKPGDSISSSSDDSVEDEKDFAPPVKKFKLDKDLVGEEGNTSDSAIDLTPREAFEIWCQIYGKVYPSKDEEDRRFDLFKLSLDRAIPSSQASNFQCLADLTEDEFNEVRRIIRQPDCYSSISWKQLKAGNHSPITQPNDFIARVVAAAAMSPLTRREAFNVWNRFYEKVYSDELEEESRFDIFNENLLTKIPSDVTNFGAFADLTKDEFQPIFNDPRCTNYISLLELKVCDEYLRAVEFQI